MCEVIYVEFDHTRILVVPCKSLGRGGGEEEGGEIGRERKEERDGRREVEEGGRERKEEGGKESRRRRGRVNDSSNKRE